MKKIFLYIFILFQSVVVNAQNDTLLYSFFSAGHTYGSPNNPHYGLHYPFVDFIPEINNYSGMEMGFLTGDIVVSGTADYWDSAQADINKLNMPVYLAAGNHDVGAEFVKRFGDYYYGFIYRNDLFIVLTPSLDAWNITGDQLAFLQNTLDSAHAEVNNIFIFLHELIWWSPTNQYQHVEINYRPHYPGSTNFDTVVKPLLLSYSNSNNITLYAGDLGCTNSVSPYMYDHFGNVTLIGSGMGGGVRDNIMVTEVYHDSVYYNLVAINGDDPKALGEIYDFSLNSTGSKVKAGEFVDVYPNPAVSGSFYVNNKFLNRFDMYIYNMQGKEMGSEKIQKKSVTKIDAGDLTPGIYFLQFYDRTRNVTKRIIVK